MSIEIKNEQLRYCVNRLHEMECKTDGDLIFQGQCLSAVWDKIYKLQPELISGKMNFGQAIEALKNGKKVARSGWNGKGMFVYYVPANKYEAYTEIGNSIADEDGLVAYNPYFAIKNVNGTVSTWVPSINDCLAEDWILVN